MVFAAGCVRIREQSLYCTLFLHKFFCRNPIVNIESVLWPNLLCGHRLGNDKANDHARMTTSQRQIGCQIKN